MVLAQQKENLAVAKVPDRDQLLEELVNLGR